MRANAEVGTRNSEWMTVRLGDVVEIDRNGIDATRLLPSAQYIGLEHLDAEGGIAWGETVESSGVRSTKFQFTSRHILFGKLRPYLRKVARPDREGVCSTDILPLLPRHGFDKDFLFHLLRSDDIIHRATQACAGANLPRLSPEKFRAFAFRVPCPSKSAWQRSWTSQIPSAASSNNPSASPTTSSAPSSSTCSGIRCSARKLKRL